MRDSRRSGHKQADARLRVLLAFARFGSGYIAFRGGTTVSYENYAPPRSVVEGLTEEAGSANAPALWIPSTTANI